MSWGCSGPPLLPSLPVICEWKYVKIGCCLEAVGVSSGTELWFLVKTWLLWPFLLSFLKQKGIFCQCLQLFSQTMQEENGSFTSIEISLNWFPSSGLLLLEGLRFSLVMWWLWKSLGTELQDQAMLNPKGFLSELFLLLWCQHRTLLIHTRVSCQLHPPKHQHPFVNSQSIWNISCQYNGKIESFISSRFHSGSTVS